MINNVVLMGRLTADPELRKTGSDISVLSFTIAVDKSYSKENKQEADFIDCVAWRGTAEFVSKYFKKGSMIALVGSMQTRSYEDKDGQKRKKTEILVESTSFCGGKNESGTNLNLNVVPQNSDIEDAAKNDDLPF
jgi:single-strand DNA-binding protein